MVNGHMRRALPLAPRNGMDEDFEMQVRLILFEKNSSLTDLVQSFIPRLTKRM